MPDPVGSSGGSHPPNPIRLCKRCGADLIQRANEPVWAYIKRQTCGQSQCTGRPAKILWAGPTVPTEADAPRRCPRCAGPRKPTPEGFGCMTCAWQVRVETALLDTLSRGGRSG